MPRLLPTVCLTCLLLTPALVMAAKREAKLSSADARDLRAELTAYFEVAPDERDTELKPSRFDHLLAQYPRQIRQLVWEAYRASPSSQSLKPEFERHETKFRNLVMPYTVQAIGKKPKGGWPVFLAMHGGGGAPKRLNDSQWKIMQRYYLPGTEGKNLLYVALRAPTDRWNGFYDDYIYPLVNNHIRQLLLFADADPNKIFIMGYSHGGYGAFSIGPKMADRFAAIHSSAAAHSVGKCSAKTLRNTVFTYMVGERDLAHGRLNLCKQFDEQIKTLRGERRDIYPVTFELMAGHGHGGLPDRKKIASMIGHVRQPVPKEISWELTDGVVRYFNWLSVPSPYNGKDVAAECDDNRIELTTKNIEQLRVYLDDRLVDMQKPVVVVANGEQVFAGKPERRLTALCQSLQERGDPELMFDTILKIEPNGDATK